MKSIKNFLEEAHKISLKRDIERNLNEALYLLKNKKINDTIEVIKKVIKLQKEI